MADQRQRAYYTKGQTINGLQTSGGEWMYVDGTEYIGQYHRYTTGEVFTESSFVNGISRTLIPYVDITQINQQNEIGIDVSKNFEYDSIKTFDVIPSGKPNPAFVQPTDKDRANGYFLRYFAIRANGDEIIEITTDDIQTQGSENGLDINLYNTFSIRWKISGPVNDILDSMGNIKEAGILDTNIRTINVKSETYPPLKKYITDFLEFSY
jgi:hypothetical protein